MYGKLSIHYFLSSFRKLRISKHKAFFYFVAFNTIDVPVANDWRDAVKVNGMYILSNIVTKAVQHTQKTMGNLHFPSVSIT